MTQVHSLLYWSFILILVFLLVMNAGNAVKIFGSLTEGYVSGVKALQGR